MTIAKCSCQLTTPCSDNCSCASPYSSGGCKRCVTFGNLDQQMAAANRIAKIFQNAKAEELDVCKKCGHGAMGWFFKVHADKDLSWYSHKDKGFPQKECIIKTCQRCGYQWWVNCLDDKEINHEHTK
jgi:hypothetical protein